MVCVNKTLVDNMYINTDGVYNNLKKVFVYNFCNNNILSQSDISYIIDNSDSVSNCDNIILYSKLFDIFMESISETKLSIDLIYKASDCIGVSDLWLDKNELNSIIENFNSKENILISDLVELYLGLCEVLICSEYSNYIASLILFRECLRSNICPFIMRKDTRGSYTKAMQSLELDDLLDYFLEEQMWFFNNITNIIEL